MGFILGREAGRGSTGRSGQGAVLAEEGVMVGGFLEEVMVNWSLKRGIHSTNMCHTPTLGTVLYSPG